MDEQASWPKPAGMQVRGSPGFDSKRMLEYQKRAQSSLTFGHEFDDKSIDYFRGEGSSSDHGHLLKHDEVRNTSLDMT